MDKEFLIGMGVSLILTAVKGSVKNAKAKASMKAAMLKVFLAIKALYAGDEDFE